MFIYFHFIDSKYKINILLLLIQFFFFFFFLNSKYIVSEYMNIHI